MITIRERNERGPTKIDWLDSKHSFSLWAHTGNGWIFSNESSDWEFPALLVVMTIAVQESGAFALKKLPIIDNFIPQFLKA